MTRIARYHNKDTGEIKELSLNGVDVAEGFDDWPWRMEPETAAVSFTADLAQVFRQAETLDKSVQITVKITD